MEPELSSVLDFVEYLVDEDRDSFTHVELAELSHNLRRTTASIRKELEDWGLKLATRVPEKQVRGYTSWDENKYAGNPMCGGTGYEQINGFAGQKG